ncbi:MAG: hypothetical protein EB828_00630 [Nitrosopumilus sp. D6]|nr:MAG: hypothetical protein EB828_00630 [Nitrosopumilus sp. D6]
MAKIRYSDLSMHRATMTLLDSMTPIIESYEERGYRMTVRQLYYQLVARLIVTNTMSSYQKVSKIVTQGRMQGMIDWDIIVDRVRVPMMPNEFYSMSSFVDAIKNSYRSYRWEDQNHYVEVMVEKEALAGILEPITRKYHASLLVNKGYASASAIHEVAMRMQKQEEAGKICHILYMGDHDPSGIDMVRDIESRLHIFGCSPKVERLALTMDQIKQYKLPPNPAKKSDPRSKLYYEKYGSESWELDALDPEVLSDVLEDGIQEYMDIDLYNTVIKKEKIERDALIMSTRNL